MIWILIYLIIVLIASLLGLFFFKKSALPQRIITVLLLVTLVSESISTYLPIHGFNNYPVYHFYVIIAFWLYSLIYFLFLPNQRARFFILLIPILFTIFSVINSLSFQKLDSFPSINIMTSNVILIVYCLIYFKYLIDLNPFQSLRKKGSFWFNCAVLVYFTMQIFIWGILNYLIKNHLNVNPVLNFGLAISIIYYITIGFSIWLDRGSKNLLFKNEYERVKT